MKLLLKREQTSGRFLDVQFKLWAKIELDDAEQALVDRYRFADSVLIDGAEQNLLRRACMIGGAITLILGFLLHEPMGSAGSLLLGLMFGGGVGYWYYNENRETLFLKDLLYGRSFTCPGIIALAKKEAWIEELSVIARQVIETAKHWGGTQTNDIPVLEPKEAKAMVANLG